MTPGTVLYAKAIAWLEVLYGMVGVVYGLSLTFGASWNIDDVFLLAPNDIRSVVGRFILGVSLAGVVLVIVPLLLWRPGTAGPRYALITIESVFGLFWMLTAFVNPASFIFAFFCLSTAACIMSPSANQWTRMSRDRLSYGPRPVPYVAPIGPAFETYTVAGQAYRREPFAFQGRLPSYGEVAPAAPPPPPPPPTPAAAERYPVQSETGELVDPIVSAEPAAAPPPSPLIGPNGEPLVAEPFIPPGFKWQPPTQRR